MTNPYDDRNRVVNVVPISKTDAIFNSRETDIPGDNLDEMLEYLKQSGGTEYEAGDGITIEDKVISANTESTTVDDIQVSSGAPINALNVWENNIIPAGSSVQDILTKLLCKELFPDAATKPAISLSGGTNLGLKTVGSKVTIPAISASFSVGKFNASYTTPAQPTPEGVTWTNKSMAATVSKFSGVTISTEEASASSIDASVELGSNSVTYTQSGRYSAPSNFPKTNLGNDTSVTATGASAIWTAADTTNTTSVTATGVYPIFTNIKNGALIDNASVQYGALTDGNIVTIANVPAETVSQKHFMIEYPTENSRTVTKFEAYNALSKVWDEIPSSNYDITTGKTHTVNGTSYNYARINPNLPFAAVSQYRLTLSKALNQ